jgi:hypothetical protein
MYIYGFFLFSGFAILLLINPRSWDNVSLLFQDRKNKDNEDREENGDKIMFDSDIQDKVTISVSCLITVDKTK